MWYVYNLIIVFFIIFPTLSYAQNQNPKEIIQRVNSSWGNSSFIANKVQQVIRQDLTLDANISINFNNNFNFKLSFIEPLKLNGISIYVDSNKEIAYLPNSLYFINSSKAGLDIPIDVIFNRITDDIVLLERNYHLFLLNNDKVGNRETYVIDIQPINGFLTPGRRFWVDKINYHILREERYWDPNYGSYFISYYKDINFTKVSIPDFAIDKKIRQIEFKPNSNNFFQKYINIEKAEKDCKQKITLPTYVPNGFILKSIEVIRLFDINIIMLRYYDGLNSLWVSYRKETNFFLTLAAGIFSMKLLEHLGDLSYHLPYNYYTTKKTGYLAVAFGDLYPEDLEKVCNSLVF